MVEPTLHGRSQFRLATLDNWVEVEGALVLLAEADPVLFEGGSGQLVAAELPDLPLAVLLEEVDGVELGLAAVAAGSRLAWKERSAERPPTAASVIAASTLSGAEEAAWVCWLSSTTAPGARAGSAATGAARQVAPSPRAVTAQTASEDGRASRTVISEI